MFVLIILHSLYLEYDREGEGFSLGLRSFLPEISIVNSGSSLPPSASSSRSHDHKLTSEWILNSRLAQIDNLQLAPEYLCDTPSVTLTP